MAEVEESSESDSEDSSDYDADDIPTFSQERLSRMPVSELRGICQKFNIRQASVKANYVKNIRQA